MIEIFLFNSDLYDLSYSSEKIISKCTLMIVTRRNTDMHVEILIIVIKIIVPFFKYLVLLLLLHTTIFPCGF